LLQGNQDLLIFSTSRIKRKRQKKQQQDGRRIHKSRAQDDLPMAFLKEYMPLVYRLCLGIAKSGRERLFASGVKDVRTRIASFLLLSCRSLDNHSSSRPPVSLAFAAATIF
jgi:hypothetical protein